MRRRLRVLLIEDDPVKGRQIGKALIERDYQVTWVMGFLLIMSDGTAWGINPDDPQGVAFKLCLADHDAVLLDYYLEGNLNGPQIMAALRKASVRCAKHVCAISNRPDLNQEILDMGAMAAYLKALVVNKLDQILVQLS